MKNEKHIEPVRFFIHATMFKEGIVPMEDPTMDVRRALASLPPEEARALKRKFRKMWRKEMKSEILRVAPSREPAVKSLYVNTQCVDKKTGKVTVTGPSRKQKLHRKHVVYQKFYKNHVLPLLEKFQNIQDTKE